MKANWTVEVDGTDISAALNPVLISFSVSDKAGSSSDTCSLEIDDTDGRLILPQKSGAIAVSIGWEGGGLAEIFRGVIDEVSATGSRSGRKLSVSAKGVDTGRKAKQGQRRHFDDKTIGEALQVAGKFAGISVDVDPELASTKRPYIALDDESFMAFGERIANEVGGTFKINGDQAILAKRNEGKNPAGQGLPSVTAVWGDNLHSYSVTPLLGRPVEKETLTRWYDPKKAKWEKETADTGTEGGETTKPAIYSEPDQSRAKEQSKTDAGESDRRSGEGSVTIEGNTAAYPEALCFVSGCRAGIDGTYRIESVTHNYSRSGWTTNLELRQPKGGAGKDDRDEGPTETHTVEEGTDFALPHDPVLG